uniref:CAP-Gly domain-containing protein n=1 Tax=Knipowitschia caucasica TaxID=637954 RepID=A0AAV2KUF4_KNICA
MRRSKRAEAVLQSGLDVKASDEITSAWNGLAQSKAALRQIENKLEAGPGSGVLLESVMVSSKKKPSRKDLNKDGQQRDQIEKSTKMRSGHSRSPEKSSSRGPLQNSTQENTARNSVEFREPLASYREATPPPHPSSKPELGSLQSATGSSYSSQLSNSNLVYERESRDKQTDEDVDSTHSSTVERMEIRYLNDLPALDTIRTNLSHSRELTREAIQQTSTVKAQILQSTDGKGSGSTPSTSPGSASQRLENLRRHQPDDKLEKLKERIRKQRKHLEEAAEKEKFGSYLERPLVGNDSCGTSTIPSVKVRKVAAAPSAPIYKGFNSTQTKIQTPDGKIWREEDFHNLSCGIYKDLSHQFAEGTRSLLLKGQGDFPKERKPHKSVRKVQKVHPISDLSRPAISPASWREGQKLVTMILGKNPIVTTEEPQKSKRSEEKGSHCRSSSEPDMSDDIKGILDDLQLQCKNRESDERTHATSQRETSRRHNRGNSGSRSRATIPTVGTASARGCRSASPSNRSRTVNRVEPVQKKRHYDADTVRQYIAQQQEKRKRRQMQEKNALMKEAEQRQQRLQELYRKQREAALTLTTTTESPAQVHLKKTFNKLLHEGAQRTQEATQLRPIYQPSGESDKENRRLEQAQSLSSSDQSLNPLPGSSNDFHFGEASSFESVGLGLATAQEEHSEKNWQQHKVHPDPHNSSESLSEGPLSEGSLTDGDGSPLQSANAFRPIGHQGAVQHSGRKSHQRLSEFQKEAEQFAVVNSLLTQQENSNPVWEEFNKGSPLSVINIFTKTLQENVKVGDIFSERNSPSVHQLPSGSHVADLDYENDPQKDVHTSSCHYEELMRRSTRGAKAIDPSASSPQHSSCSTPGSSPLSKNSIKMRDQSAGTTLVEEHRSTPLPEALSLELRKWDSKRSSENSQITSDDISQLSHRGSNVAKMSPPSNNRQSPGSLDHSSLENSFSDSLRRSAPEKATNTSAADVKPSGELQYSPAVLQQRLAAELHYLESIEESVRQLGDIERLMGVSKAQHESETLSHMLKAKQQQHEQELYELKIKAEREALETKLQMEQNRQRVARAHIDLQEGLATTHKETLEGLQEATTKMMSQQAEAARYTADTARHIKEMTEMAHAHLINYTPPSVQLTSELLKKRSHARMRDNTNLSYESSRTGEDHLDHSESESYRSPGRSLSSEHKDTSHEPLQERSQRAEGSISIEDEVTTAANESLCNSIPSVQEERGDATSVATDYSHKFEESITEDEIEERSFRSLLPSEAHRRESLDRKLQHHNESEEDGMSHNCTPALVAYSITQHQRGSSAFSGGQDSFSHFTMEMVRQYMRDEEVRLQHQSALLRLRQKALKEKTRTELAWLEHQKKKLRDKGEDDKMPPIKKKQRGLLLKLQQEQAEIKRLQEANKAARKERQVLLKQQEEIERMRSSTLKLKERLRFAETLTEAPSETSLSEVASSNLEHTNLNVRSPSPSVSISGSETSSIMQKLKKMRSQTDEKFLTKREQQLMQRRHHAEELLQWKQRLDKEEAEVLKMEKKALAAWDEQPPQDKGLDLSESEKDFRMMQGSKDFTGDFNHSSATPESSIHTDVDVKQGETSASKSTSASDMASIQSSPANYTDDFASVSPSPNRPSDQKSPIKESIDVSVSEHDQMSKLGDITDNHDMKQTEHISDQRDIETRIRTLKEELKKRKLTAYQLKKEQKKRTKQRLKAQEANLLKQLETYNDFIEKTKAELEQQPDSTPDATSQITDGVLRSAEHPSETMTRERSHLTHVSESDGLPSFVDKAHPGQNRSVSMASTISGFCIGDRVVVSGVQPGTLRFKGSTSFANGFWAGVELDKSEGSNNGTYDGVLYFECSERHGIFAPPDKVTHLTDKFDMYTDTTEDDDSFHDEMPKEENLKLTSKETRPQTDPFGNCLMSLEKLESGDLKSSDDIEQLDKAVDNYQHLDHTIVNGNTIWVSGDASLTPLTPFIDNDKVHISKQSKMEITNLIEKPDVELDHRVLFSSDLKKDERRKDRLGSLADEMLNDIVKNAVQHFAELKKSKVKKIHDANQMSRNKVEEVEETLAPSVDQKDGLPFFLTQEKEEMSSPELCNRPESPVLGASGQEELAKRLAELELSREMEEFGDDQDWFDEDYGLSSRRQQQRLKEKQLEEDQAKFGGHFGKTTSGVGTVMGGPGDQQVKTPPRPELPHPIAPKLPEEPAMVVPHSAAEIEKIAHAAVLEIWKTCGLDSEGLAILTNQQNPNPSQEYYGEDSHSDDLEAACLHSYKKAVYDLTWETLQDVFAEDPNADQPQWVKPQRVKSSSFHEIRTARDISRIQRFVSDEILKLYGLATDQCQRTDWPKMLKFGRKKRDRVDNILVQELHEEESQWVNYDEDELFVKMQLADSIFDALLKDTADALNLIYEKRAKRDAS